MATYYEKTREKDAIGRDWSRPPGGGFRSGLAAKRRAAEEWRDSGSRNEHKCAKFQATAQSTLSWL